MCGAAGGRDHGITTMAAPGGAPERPPDPSPPPRMALRRGLLACEWRASTHRRERVATIDYFLFAPSPFTYLGHDLLREIAGRHGAGIRYRPVDLMGVWAESGAQPPAKRPPVRQRYRMIELKRLALYRDLALNPRPAHFPVDATLADSCVIAIQEAGGDPHDFVGANCRSVWVDDENIAEERVVRANLMATGHDADAVVAAAGTDEVKAIRAANTADCIAADAPGVPAYVLKGEVFWGQDRLEHLDRMLATGREPITA